MFGSEPVGDLPRLVDRSGQKNVAVFGERLSCCGIRSNSRSDLADHRRRERPLRGYQYGERLGIMLGLRDQLRGNVCRIAFVAGDDDLGGAGQHVDGAVEGDKLFGGGDIRVSWANYLIYARDGFRPISQRSDGLRAADAIEMLNS